MNELLDLPKLIRDKDADKIVQLIKKHALKIESGKIKIPKQISEDLFSYWDKRQLVRKILLNSALTGALN